ncbi:PilW family protein [Chitiniphilus shinanonensis]|nr:prepilin-type N-terminal cleavage/methylation domain-containing protein [Chitiniphilus shinanonensis]
MRQRGFSLIEILVALAIAIFLLGVVGTYLLTNLRAQSAHLRSVALTDNMNTALDLMTKEIRRAGFHQGPSYISAAQVANINTIGYAFPASASTDDLKRSINKTLFKSDRPSDSCVLYSYNRNRNFAATTPANLIDVVDNDEQQGFKLADNSIQMRTSCSGSACMSSCDTGTWTALSDIKKMKIEKLLFCYYPTDSEPPNLYYTSEADKNEPGTATCSGVGSNMIIYLRASDPTDTSVMRTVKSSVKIRNE